MPLVISDAYLGVSAVRRARSGTAARGADAESLSPKGPEEMNGRDRPFELSTGFEEPNETKTERAERAR
jgi:hypothetical protein